MSEKDGSLELEMIEHLRRHYEGVISWPIEYMFCQSYGEKQMKLQFRELNDAVELRKNMEILDLGCGYGHFVSYLLERGLDCYGADIDKEACGLAKKLLTLKKHDPSRIKPCFENEIEYHVDFKDESFDLIHTHFVMEHVKHADRFFKEMYRILKKGGNAYLICPNYRLCHEPHYAIFFFKWAPKSLNKIYLRLRGRDGKFFDSLNLVTPDIERNMIKYGFKFKNIGKERWLSMFNETNVEDRPLILQKIVKFVNIFHLGALIKLLTEFEFYTPLIYVLEKD